MAAIVAETAYTLSSSLILPFNAETYGIQLNREFNKLKNKYGDKLESWNISLSRFESAINNFTSVAKSFHQRLESIDKTK